ncbi:MAG: type II secretion system protein [Eubacteriales bacterium]|nr:type II secretion system protein [Eubacteriales bacterium]
MKNTKKRGFTIVELVVVIAVIAILASVLIPTFANVVKKAKESAAMQNARSAWTAYLADEAFNGKDLPANDGCIYVENGDAKYGFKIVKGTFTGKVCEETGAHNCYTITDGKITVDNNGTATTASHTHSVPAVSGENAG